MNYGKSGKKLWRKSPRILLLFLNVRGQIMIKKKKNYLEKLRYRKKKNLWKRLTEYQKRFQQRTSASQMMSLDRVQQKKSSVPILWLSSC